jgi:deferrochelatase/peroxidase EfeB
VSRREERREGASRRGFLKGGAGLVAAAATARGAAGAEMPAAMPATGTEPFWGAHQGGILTPVQSHTYFAAFDLATGQREDVVRLLQAWTAAAARLTRGETAQPLSGGLEPVVMPGGAAPAKGYDAPPPPDWAAIAADSGEALGTPPSRLTLTFGFGIGLFEKDKKDRYGLAARRPEALVELPRFIGDQLVEAHSGGDLSVQACADDAQVAFHAVRQLARIADDVARVRWVQSGFMPGMVGNQTPRNLMGFKDGTANPRPGDAPAMARFVWIGEGPDWLQGGTYLVARRIRIALEHWDRMKLVFQEQTIGRHKYSGAPLGKSHEFDALDLDATGKDGNPAIPESAHVRLAAAASNGGAQILRRPYSYNDGADITAERWPPWRQGLEYDAGLFFLCYQRDPRTGFIPIYANMAKLDMMNQFVTHVGSGVFVCPRGAAAGEFIGQGLFDTA